VLIDYLSDLGLRRITYYTLLYRSEVLFFNCCLSAAKYPHRLSAMKNKNIGIGQNKPYLSSST